MKVFELSFVIKANNLSGAIKTMLKEMTISGITNERIPLKERIKKTKKLLICMERKMGKVKEKCQSCSNDAREDHICPYREEMQEDKVSLCNCCEECEHSCAMDI